MVRDCNPSQMNAIAVPPPPLTLGSVAEEG